MRVPTIPGVTGMFPRAARIAGVIGAVLAVMYGGEHQGGARAQPAPLPTETAPLAPPPNGPRRTEPLSGWTALTDVTVHVKPGTSISGATVVLREGRVQGVWEKGAEKASELPPASQRVDGTGLHVYAGFIEPFVEVAVARPDTTAPGVHWNGRITPQRDVLERGSAGIDDKLGQTLRSLGFTAAGLSPKGGLIRGTGAVVALTPKSPDPSDRAPTVYARAAFQAAGFEDGDEFNSVRGGRGDDARWSRYPDSQMGAIALIRQTFLDADWVEQRAEGTSGQPADALTALFSKRGVPMAWDCGNELEALRAVAIGREFKRAGIIVGSGREYRRLEALAATKTPIVVPLNYPRRPRVSSIGEAEEVGLGALIAWEQAPTNARRLDAAGISVALTSSKIPDKLGGRAAFSDRLSMAIKHGLPPARALAMLTTNPAQMLGLEKQMGTVEAGKLANLVVADGPLFADKPDAPKVGEDGYVKAGKIIEVWIDGRRYPTRTDARLEVTGTWKVEPAGDAAGDGPTVTIEIQSDRTVTLVREVIRSGKKVRTVAKAREWSLDGDGRFSLVVDGFDPLGDSEVHPATTVSGVIEREAGGLVMHARQVDGKGVESVWRARRDAEDPSAPKQPRAFRATPGAIAGAWVMGPGAGDGSAKVNGAALTVITLSRDKTLTVKRGEQELAVADVIFDTAADPSGGSEPIVASVRFSVTGWGGVDQASTLTLTPTKESGRLEMKVGGDSATLVRRRETPESEEVGEIPERLGLPVGAYGSMEVPEQQSVLISNATVWTSGPAGVIEKGFVTIQGGKIGYVGATAPDLQGEWIRIDAAGKHVTPGIIDCHSHTGISSGVNESGQAVTAEVRIGDVTDPDSISWYRQLAGGVTCVNSLHGSANPIGGQNQVNKVRWGCVAPNDMHLAGAKPGIKFALGENVKQSNWGDGNTTRYPQTRMGVEGLIRDRFLAARQYAAERKAGVVRRDLELEALAEILAGERLIHCHSYRQDEILMLARLAQEFGFKIGTYQHILEGYKVADAVRDSSLGASAFSDWWAYKVEVQDAIPYAGPIMHEVGVVVSYNSDSDEMARRMNVEAGKALKYGGPGMTPSEAFKFVTLNPAKQLKIEDRVGSLEVGKDGDVVLWSGPPMSPTSRAERTWVDGRELFSIERDAALRAEAQKERRRIIQKILRAQRRESGGGSPSVSSLDAASDGEGAGKKSDAPPEAWGAGRGAGWGAGGLEEGQRERDGRRLLLLESLRQAREARRDLFMNALKRRVDVRWMQEGDCGCGVLGSEVER